MYPLVVLVAVSLVASASAQLACDPIALGASIISVLPLAQRPGCLCDPFKGCERGNLAITPTALNYEGPLLGPIVAAKHDDHFDLRAPPENAGKDLLTIKEENHIVFVICDLQKQVNGVMIDFTEKPADAQLDELQNKYGVNVAPFLPSCGF